MNQGLARRLAWVRLLVRGVIAAGLVLASGRSGAQPNTASTTPTAARLPVPDAAAQAKAEKLVGDIFGPSTRVPPAERAAVAGTMLDQAMATNDDPPARYVLLKRATELAATGGDVKTAVRAATETGRLYATDPDDLRLDALRKCAAGATPEAAAAVAGAALACADDAARADRVDAATRYASVAETAARGAKDAALVSGVQARATEIRSLRQESARARAAEDKLSRNPQDADANLVLGRYLCTAKEDWGRGLPLLAKGSSAPLRQAAAADQARPSDAEKQVAVADGWWDLAEREPAMARRAIRGRAVYWYQKASDQGQLTGLSRVRVEKRIATAAATANLDPQQAAAEAKLRSVLLFGDGAVAEIFKAIGGEKLKQVQPKEHADVMGAANPFDGVAVVVFAPNRLRDTPVTDLTDNFQAALQRFVKDGGDFVIFEQFAHGNMGIVERLFDIRVGGGGRGAQVTNDALAAKVSAAGYSESMLKEIQFYNSYDRLPRDAAVLMRAGTGRNITAAVVPYGKGRLVLMGSTVDATERRLVEAVVELVYNVKIERQKPKG